MKILVCPKGIIEVVVNNKSQKIVGMSPSAQRGYLVVSDEDAKELLTREGYEIVDISQYSSTPENLPSGLKEIIEKHQGQITKEEPEQNETSSESNIPVDVQHETISTPIPVFMPAVWTGDNIHNYPVTISYSDRDGNATSFVFTQDYTIHPCTWCRFKYWLRNKFRRSDKT